MSSPTATPSSSFQKRHARSHRSEKLSCGVSRVRLSQFYDYRHGAGDALAPSQYATLERHVFHCDQCQHFIAEYGRLHSHVRGLHEREISEANSDVSWLNTIMDALVLEVERGEALPIEPLFSFDSLGISEGAVRALVRRYGSNTDIVIASTHIRPLCDEPLHPGIDLALEVTTHVRHGAQIPTVVEASRERIWKCLRRQTDLSIQLINIVVSDIFCDNLRDTTTVTH